MNAELERPTVDIVARHPSTFASPQALAWHRGEFWLSSRDLRRIYQMEAATWSVRAKFPAPGIPWAAVSVGDTLRFTCGVSAGDDRYVYSYTPGGGFEQLFACPDFTGSYLSYDGGHLYLSQWYKKRVLQLDAQGKITREIDLGAEICGHTFVDGVLYVLRGVEKPAEAWRIARVDLRAATPAVEDLALVPFAARSLAFDGKNFWSNHRAGNETTCFSLPH